MAPQKKLSSIGCSIAENELRGPIESEMAARKFDFAENRKKGENLENNIYTKKLWNLKISVTWTIY